MFVLICKQKDAGFGVFFPCYLIMPYMLEKHEVSCGKQGGRFALTSYCASWEKQVSQGVWPSGNCGLEPQKLCSIWQKCYVCPKCVLKGNVLPFFFFFLLLNKLFTPLLWNFLLLVTSLLWLLLGWKQEKVFFTVVATSPLAQLLLRTHWCGLDM